MTSTRIFTRILCAIVLIVGLALTGCNKDRKNKGGTKPPPPKDNIQKVPDAPSGLQLSAIAIAAVAAYAAYAKPKGREEA